MHSPTTVTRDRAVPRATCSGMAGAISASKWSAGRSPARRLSWKGKTKRNQKRRKRALVCGKAVESAKQRSEIDEEEIGAFVTYDERLGEAATKHGLSVVQPA